MMMFIIDESGQSKVRPFVRICDSTFCTESMFTGSGNEDGISASGATTNGNA
jgi:hypothetical protein